MALDQLKFALDNFSQGVSEYQTTQAVNDARQQLAQLQQSEQDKGILFQKTAQVGQDLALRLTAANASPEKIAAATGSLAPSASMSEQVQSTERGQSLGYNKALDVEKLKAASNENIAHIHADALLGKDTAKENNLMNNHVTKFASIPENKTLLDSVTKLDESLGLIDQNKGQMGATMATQLAKVGLARSIGGRFNPADFAAADESPSIRAKIWKELGLQTSGEVPSNIQDFWRSTISTLKDKAQARLKAAVEGHITGANPAWDQGQLRNMMQNRYAPYIGGSSGQSSHSADIQSALDWLSSPEASNESPATRKAVIDRIKQLQGGK